MATPLPGNSAAFSASELAVALGLASSAVPPEGVQFVTTNSRQAGPGSLFVALRGERFDGHAFLPMVREGGGKAVLVEPEFEDAARSLGLWPVVVADTLEGLGRLAAAHRRRWGGRVVAIAGSAGKTTTKSVVGAFVAAARPGRTLITRGNLNNLIGVPLTLLSLEPVHEYAVIEIGTNQPGEVARLSEICQPDMGLLTLIALEHTEGLGDEEGVAEEELSLFRQVMRSGRVLLGNADDLRIVRALAESGGCVARSYGTAPGADSRLLRRKLLDNLLTELDVDCAGKRMSLTSPLSGLPGALAVLAGLLVLDTWFPGELGRGIRETDLSRALAQSGEDGRGVLYEHESGALIVDDSYNSNPASVRAGIQTAQEMAAARNGRLVLVLGEMLELGALAVREHQALGEFAAKAAPEVCVFVRGAAEISATAARRCGISAVFVENAALAAEQVLPGLRSGDVVLLKGSRGVGLEQVRLLTSARRLSSPQDS